MPPLQRMEYVNRIDRNEYKRYQAAPGLKVTSQSFARDEVWRTVRPVTMAAETK